MFLLNQILFFFCEIQQNKFYKIRAKYLNITRWAEYFHLQEYLVCFRTTTKKKRKERIKKKKKYMHSSYQLNTVFTDVYLLLLQNYKLAQVATWLTSRDSYGTTLLWGPALRGGRAGGGEGGSETPDPTGSTAEESVYDWAEETGASRVVAPGRCSFCCIWVSFFSEIPNDESRAVYPTERKKRKKNCQMLKLEDYNVQLKSHLFIHWFKNIALIVDRVDE